MHKSYHSHFINYCFSLIQNIFYNVSPPDEFKGSVSYFTHMLLRITNLKALGQRFQVLNRRWRPQTRVSMVENAIIPDEKKHQDDEHRRKSLSNQPKRIYLVNNIFEAWENAKIEAGCKHCSDSDFAAIRC